jgi:WD40 repeat protein
VKIWDVQTLEPVQPAEPVTRYLATAFSSNLEVLAFGVAKNSQVKLWNLSTGQEIAKFNEDGHKILVASFSQDGRRIATGGQDRQVSVWEAFTDKLIHTMKGHQAFVESVDFSPDGTTLVSGSEDRTLRLWDTATGKEIGLFEDGSENYYRAVFSPDGKRLASSCRDGRVKLWDVARRTRILYFTGHDAGGHSHRVFKGRQVAGDRGKRQFRLGVGCLDRTTPETTRPFRHHPTGGILRRRPTTGYRRNGRCR